jgi:glycosyltransferase involved in cell wall biosynthesis
MRALRADGPDVLFVQDYSSGRFDALLAISRWLRVPLIAYHSGSTFDSYSAHSIRRRTLPRADALLMSSHREKDAVVARFGVDPRRCHVVLTPIDLDAFRPDRSATAEPPSFLFVGRLDDRVKRVSALIEAFGRASSEHEDASLVIVGTGPDEARLRDLARSVAGDRVRFQGWVTEPDRLRALYNAADALVLPSLREGFPTVVGEALACGTPVLASDVGGISELVQSGVTGRLFPPGDDRALLDALVDAIERRESLTEMRAAARKVAEERVAPDIVAAQLQTIVDEVTSKRGKR